MAPAASEVASFLGARYVGPDIAVTDVDALDAAGPGDLAFCIHDDPAAVATSEADVIICLPTIPRPRGQTLVYSPNPKAAFARVVAEFFEYTDEGGIHPTAVVESEATIGANCRIEPNVYIAGCVALGDRCTIRAGAALGCDGFGFVRDQDGVPLRLPHRGGVYISDDVEVGANTTIDRSVFGNTVVEDRAKLSAQVHIAHGAHIGQETLITYGCGIAGNATIGDRVKVNPHVTIATDVTVADDAELGMNATVLDDVPSDTTVVGSPAAPIQTETTSSTDSDGVSNRHSSPKGGENV